MKGRIEKIWDNESRNGQRYLGVSIDGQRYTLWEEKYFDQLQEGDVIDFEWKKSGRFRNITKINMNEEDNNFAVKRHKDIVKMSCLKSASELIAGTDVEADKRADMAIDFARKFEDYMREDREEGKEPDKNKKHR
ncbi:MAG: hypothetical protein ACFFDT_03410 [Candidatus Hodarchaeota archaeon]